MGSWLSRSKRQLDDEARPRGINIANSFRVGYVFVSGAFVEFPCTEKARAYAEYQEDDAQAVEGADIIESSGDAVQNGHFPWEIQASRFGVAYSVIPTFIEDLPPMRIDLVIPDQTDWPPSLWSKLGARDSVHLTGDRIRSLGICKHLAKGLRCWAARTDGFEQMYRSQPFGSTIRLAAVTEQPEQMEFEFVANHKALSRPGAMLSAAELSELWGFDKSEMPPSVPLSALRHKSHLSGEVILVTLPRNGLGMPETTSRWQPQLVFKSSKKSFSELYHEIKNLMSMEALPSLMPRPEFLVTIEISGEPRVCGFLARYYPGGTLEDVLPQRRLNGTLQLRHQVGWALDLVKTLIHVKQSPIKFYSDLRPDQLVLSPNPDGSETAVLLDFEQSRNLYNWAPEEIYFLEWIAELGLDDFARTDDLPKEVMSKYSAMLKEYLTSRGHPFPPPLAGATYDNPPHGWYWPWLCSSPAEQESAMVYMLGKVLWCIFEGVQDADIILGRSNPYDGQQRFPHFIRTPPTLQDLIRRCTAGAREWTDGPIRIYRRGGRVFPLGKTGLNGELEGTLDETKQAIREFWQNEIQEAEQFIAARQRHDQGCATKSDVERLSYLRRPTLAEVQEALERFGSSQL
ncbi:hypothetical protein QBC42DRAFT_329780 [Cladorrhinum samala]|uniref:Protein kinase domain-containing protein n=1 Tax=Cladorrhinum samala TaxID=585594 RepID=A0AAV9HMG1_9PEZI|nr:hypothetical protein QBC42DRAFT_329780 [Cladorrhinum samala]